MGTLSGRKSSHPVFLVTLVSRLVQATVIMVDLLNPGFPFSFFPPLPFRIPCGLPGGKTCLESAGLCSILADSPSFRFGLGVLSPFGSCFHRPNFRADLLSLT